MSFRLFSAAFLSAAMTMGAAMAADNPEKDPYLWLEDVTGARALAWVKERNEESLPVLESQPGFEAYRDRAEEILAAKDRIARPVFLGDYIYNFWQDEAHVRGLWRRASLASYKTSNPDWETVLDLDALAAQENENWVWKGATCLGPDDRRCILQLSRGGKDAVVIREFDTASKSFVKGGFEAPEAKTWFDWYDADHLLIGSDYGPGSQTESGYPRFIKLWKRGAALAKAKTIFEVPASVMSASAHSYISKQRQDRMLINLLSFWTNTYYHIAKDGRQVAWPLPEDADFKDVLDGRVIALLRTDWRWNDRSFPAGSLVAYAIDPLLETGETQVELVYTPQKGQAIRATVAAKSALYVQLLDNVNGTLLRLDRGATGWTAKSIDLPSKGSISIVSADHDSNEIFVDYEGFLTPDSLYLVGENGAAEKVKALPERFDATQLAVDQRFATSKDGTKVPYFIVHRKDMPMDGSTPTWMYGYGGFTIPLTPGYVSPNIQFWLEEGGAYVIPNIRGGGEFGPAWHQAAMLTHRQRSYDDFIAVAEDLIDSGVTSPEHLGIQGRSNGGLLMGVQLTQRPDLYSAIIVGVPLIDMLRYDKLLAGASWTGEYGDPDDPKMRDYILTYSPYQNLSRDAEYPEVFIYTSTKDDRVHPGHARKLAARLMEYGHPFLYYENTEGGHAGVANLKQNAYRSALELVYMKRRLMAGDGEDADDMPEN